MTEWKGAFCGQEQPAVVLAHDGQGWEALWRRVGQPAPAADLAGRVAVGVFAGQCRTGGYAIVWEQPKPALVRYRIEKPRGMAIQSFTQPWSVRLFAAPPEGLAVEAAS